MLSHLKAFRGQPLLMEFSYADRMAARLKEGTSADIKGMFFEAPCPMKMAERQAAEAKATGSSTRKAVGIIPVRGVLDQHNSWMMEMFGGTPVDALSAAHDILMNESRVGAILWDFHTPGGSPFGIKELADKVFASRGDKLSVSLSNSMMCSAGAFLGAPADRSFASPMSWCASIGVYSEMVSHDKANKEQGIDERVIRYPEGKAEGHPAEPISEEAVSNELADIKRLYNVFASSVAKYRGLSVAAVEANTGRGRVLDAEKAVVSGLVDGVRSFDQVLAMMQAGRIRRQSQGAAVFIDEEGPKLDSRNPDQLRRMLALEERISL